MISNNKKPSSIPFAESTAPELLPSSDSSSSSAQPNQQPNSLSRKKKESILQKISISSRRSISWLPRVHDSHHQQQQQEQQPHFVSASSGASISSINQNNNQSTKGDHHSSKTTFGKGIRSVARTVKKSLHQLERPRSIAGDHFDRTPGNSNQDTKARSSLQHQSRNDNSHASNNRSPSPSSPSQRIRAVSTSEVYTSSPNRSSNSRTDQPNQSLERSSPAQPFEPGRTAPNSSPQPLTKKPRPQSAVDLDSFPSTTVSNRQQHEHLSWHARTPVGSLPMAATILAAPSPPPVDHSTFLAIIPGQKSNTVVPSLSVNPPPTSQSVEPSALTGASMRVQPSLSRRVSLTSSAGGGNSADDNGFTFIRTPSSKPSPNNISSSTPSSPAPNGLPSSEWTEIAGHSTTLESLKSRPPLVSVSTTISLVQSCVAERGSMSELGDIVEHEQSTGYHVDEPHEESTPTGAPNSAHFSESSVGNDCVKNESRKRKVTSLANEEKNKLHQTEFDSSPAIVRQHKVLRSMDEPFSSSKNSAAVGMNYTTSHPLSLLTVNQTSTTTTTTKHLIQRLKPNTDSAQGNNEKSSLHCRNSPKSKLGSRKNPSSAISNSNNHGGPNFNKNGNEIWNLTIVSTVVGVVIIAAVLIGSTNFSSLNGKSWIGKIVKKN